MAGYQQFTIVGNVGRDVNLKYTPQGTAVADFSVAVTRKFGQGDHQQEKTLWVRINCWNKLAEIANQYVRKGSQVLVSGTVEINAYMDKSGQPQASLELRADSLQLLGSRGEQEYSSEPQGMDDVPF